MYTFIRSSVFDKWLAGLKDNGGKARILHRIRSAELGNFGDCEPVGDGVSEMRVHVGPGIACILSSEERWCTGCCWAAISPHSSAISSVPNRCLKSLIRSSNP